MSRLFPNDKAFQTKAQVQRRESDDSVLAILANHDRAARTLRAELFNSSVVNETVWLLLQELFVAHLERRALRTKELCDGEGMPPQTTVIRYLDHLERLGVVSRKTEREDRRATQVALTEQGVFWMREYYQALFENERSTFARLAGVGIGGFGES